MSFREPERPLRALSSHTSERRLVLARTPNLRYFATSETGIDQFMSLKRADQPKDALDRFGQKYRAWLAIPLMIAGVTALWSPMNAFVFLMCMLSLWILAGAITLIVRATQVVLPKSLSPENRDEVLGSISITLFLGSFALAGMVLRGENAVSEIFANSMPAGSSGGFISPTFALVCIIGIWLHTAYRVRRQ